jgi:hypothetical protein
MDWEQVIRLAQAKWLENNPQQYDQLFHQDENSGRPRDTRSGRNT